MLSRLPSETLAAVAYRLDCFLASLDPEDERKKHAAAPQVNLVRRAIRFELDARKGA